MDSVPRDPLRFDSFDLFAKYMTDKKLSFKSEKALNQFLSDFRGSIQESLKNEALVYGRRTEAMFEMVVGSLGKVTSLEAIDQGSLLVLSADKVAKPDFKVILHDGTVWYIEVKNYFARKSDKPFELKTDYLSKLEAYASMNSGRLLIAVYWSPLNIWTLVPAGSFARHADKVSVDFNRALKVSRMSLLGDIMVGTRSPLMFRMEVEELSCVKDSETESTRGVRITNTQLFSDGREIVDPIERTIAFAFMLYGGWPEDEPEAIMKEGKVVAMVHVSRHRDEDTFENRNGFSLVGNLSSLISAKFRQATSDEDGVTGARMRFEPGEFGKMFPKGFKGDVLGLWQFHLQPNDG